MSQAPYESFEGRPDPERRRLLSIALAGVTGAVLPAASRARSNRSKHGSRRSRQRPAPISTMRRNRRGQHGLLHDQAIEPTAITLSWK